ncbi:EAL domain-containing protein [Marinobacterium stanieri]|uniref:bifunctional diguanylate cyclase/phosphodiesterase n=1 Tax=Marinobacterium stanieri TaxID=49186 RepID=UPI003A91F1B3
MSPPLERDAITISSLQGVLIALAMLVILATWIFAGYQLRQNREQVLDEHKVILQNLSLVVSENINQVLDRTEAFKTLVRLQLSRGELPAAGPLATLMATDPVFTRMTVYSRNGRVLNSTSATNLPGLQQGWQASLSHQRTWPINILPSEALGKSWSVPLAMPINTQGRPDCCLLVLEMDLGYLLNLYQNLQLGRETSIHVLTAQGAELLRAERGGLVTGRSAFDNTVLLKSRLNQGTTRDLHTDNQRYYLGHFAKLERAPLVIAVRQSESEALAGYHRQRNKFLVSVVIITLIAAGGLLWLLRMMHVREVQLRELQQSEQRNMKLLARLRREHEDSVKAASRDHLTGLYNRRLFTELGHSHLAGSKRQGRFAAVCFIDLDRFKAINDTLGHKVGDNLLQEVARRLTDNLRESDIVSRFGGDEFVVMLTAVKQQADVEQKVQRLVDVLAAPYPELEAGGLATSPSIGVAMAPRDGMDIETLIKHADIAMYRAKRGGRAQFRLFDSQDAAQEVSTEELQALIPKAIERGEFQLHFQPRLSLRGYETGGFEALVRWESPQQALLMPAVFLPLVEQQLLMPALGYQLLRQLAQQLRQWADEGLDILPVALNLSASQINDPTLPGQLRMLIEEFRLTPGWLELEIGDQDLQHLGDQAIRQLRLVSDLGVGLVMDDFGSSEEGLQRVSRLPFNCIKLSPALIQHIRNSFDDNVLLSATISVARKMRLRVVAKGVETPDQLVYLKLAGCDEAQGFLFSRAVEEAEVRDYLQTPKRKVKL